MRLGLTPGARPAILAASMNAASKTEPQAAAPEPQAGAPPLRHGARWAAAALAVLAVLLGAGWLAAPVLLWAYDLERAGGLIDAGLAWPVPRRADSLPHARDAATLERALPLLAAATRHRPAHPHAYRLSGQVYAALGDWDRAATSYEQAVALAPDNPLMRYEASLVYSRMDEISRTAPRTPIIDQLLDGRLDAPGRLIKSQFCSDRGAETCYLGRVTYRQGFANDPAAPALETQAIFLHPPASLTASLAVPKDQPALHFVVGLDPAAHDWATNGASFRVWVAPVGGQRTRVADLPIDRATAQRGWVPGWADLAPWAGQTVQLTLESHPGPAGDAADDWYAWGDLAFTTPEAARYATVPLAERARDLRRGIR